MATKHSLKFFLKQRNMQPDKKPFNTKEQSDAMKTAGENLIKNIQENVLPYLNSESQPETIEPERKWSDEDMENYIHSAIKFGWQHSNYRQAAMWQLAVDWIKENPFPGFKPTPSPEKQEEEGELKDAFKTQSFRFNSMGNSGLNVSPKPDGMQGEKEAIEASIKADADNYRNYEHSINLPPSSWEEIFEKAIGISAGTQNYLKLNYKVPEPIHAQLKAPDITEGEIEAVNMLEKILCELVLFYANGKYNGDMKDLIAKGSELVKSFYTQPTQTRSKRIVCISWFNV